MILPRTFQILVCVTWLLFALTYVLPFGLGTNDTEMTRLLQFDTYGGVLSNYSRLWSTLILWGWLFASIGVFFVLRWGKWLYAALFLSSLIVTPFFGLRVGSPIETTLGSLVDVLDGAILALMYFSPVANWFEKRDNPSHG